MSEQSQKLAQSIVSAVSSIRSHAGGARSWLVERVIAELDALIKSAGGRADDVLSSLYAACPDHESAKALRALFVSSRTSWIMPGSSAIRVDLFAMPVYGDAQAIRAFLDSRVSFAALADLPARTGFADTSDGIAFMKTALPWQALMRPSVLNGLASRWLSALSNTDSLDSAALDPGVSAIVDELDQDAPRFGRGAYLIPGIRLTRQHAGHADGLTNWSAMSDTDRLVAWGVWRPLAFRLAADAGANLGDVMVRLPVPVLAAQSQALAWGMAEQMYARLNGAAAADISLLTLPPDNARLVLRATDAFGKVMAQSDPVDQFNAAACARDFSETLAQECTPNGPETRLCNNAVRVASGGY